MIKKILKISGVGKFRNFSSNHDSLNFLKNTIIFGFNAYGKSTLTTIFRSLQNSDRSYIEGKRSFNHTETIVIDILDDNDKHSTLANGNWSNKDISIFDNYFVHNSVFIGDEIDHKHKSNLYGIFIGDDINQKVKKLESLREEQSDLEKKRDKIKHEYTKSDLGSFDIFLKLNEIEDLDKKITKKNNEIEILKNIEILKKLIGNSPLNSKFDIFSKSIQKTLDVSANESIENHVKKHWKNPNASKNFLAEGVSLLKQNADSCVFCGQNISSVKDIISDFKKVFNKTYTETRQEIIQAGEIFLRLDLETEISKFLPYGVNFEDFIDKDLLLNSKGELDDDIKIKITNLNHEINCKSNNSQFQIFIKEIKKLHTVFNEVKSKEFSSEKLHSLKNESNKLNLVKYRFSNEGKKLANAYINSLDAIEKKKNEIKHLRADIDKETGQIINKNQKLINSILENDLGADFTIQKLATKSNLTRSDSHFIDYEFVIQGQSVPITNRTSQLADEPKNKYYFGNTLSDSDKRLLAMSFFIVSLKTDADLKDKIVILDDPFSSFDSNRKDYLANTIINIKNESGDAPEQLIVLTHDDGFLARLQSKLPNNDTRLLKISFNKTKGSALDICNIADIVEEQYFKDVKNIKEAVENSTNIDDALKKVRICLERLLKHKYFFLLDKKTLAEGSTSSYLEKIGDKCKVKDEILANNWHEDMHDQHQIMKLTEPEKIKKLEDFLKLMEKI
ncbi:AAA family ATPase [Patescibacteria group bacterium]|nr:AAA family ATPase [Patescibacteria group bacterium]MBU1885841.1 AAA family ATPase [Patescibacteria group bacterium]